MSEMPFAPAGHEKCDIAITGVSIYLIADKPVSIVEGRIQRSQVAVVIPTCNAEKDWSRLNAALRQQEFPPGQVLIIVSASEDKTADLASAEGYQLLRI